jgi:hypothetical protein
VRKLQCRLVYDNPGFSLVTTGAGARHGVVIVEYGEIAETVPTATFDIDSVNQGRPSQSPRPG